MKRLILMLAVSGPASVIAATLPAPSHCSPEEQVIFSCRTTRSKVVSLCASSSLESGRGYLQYRFGQANKPELLYPATKEHPRKFFSSGTQMYSGGGSAFLKFTNGDYTYVIFTGIGKGWEKEGVIVEKSGKQVAFLQCQGAWESAIGPDLFEKTKIPQDPNEDEFEIP